MTVPVRSSWRLSVQDLRVESVFVVGRKHEQCSGRHMTTSATVSDQSPVVWQTE